VKKIEINRNGIFLALASGFLLTGAFPKFSIAWLAWFALVPLLVAVRNLTAGESFKLGFIAGLAHYMSLLYWIADTMNKYGHLPLFLCLPVLFLFAACLALYVAVFSMAATRFSRTPRTGLIMIPACWVALEYLRAVLFSGFPWELLGYSQFEHVLIIQIADIFGVYGISFLIMLINTTIFTIVVYAKSRDGQRQAMTQRVVVTAVLICAVIFAGVLGYGAWRMKCVDELAANAPMRRIAVVQGNIEQSIKWEKMHMGQITEKYIRLSLSAKPHGPDLLVWPETAMPFYFPFHTRLSAAVIKGVRDTGSSFLIGRPSFTRQKDRVKYYNSAFLMTPAGDIAGKYNKAHLVPFGEYVPFRKYLPFLGKIVPQAGDFSPGESGLTLNWQDFELGVQICYEAIFPELSRKMVENGASLLINITNDAWYGRSSAPFQHFSMAVFRAVENRRSLVRSANTGISGFVDPAGRVVTATGLFEEAAITRPMPMMHAKSLYTRYGDFFAVACLVLSAVALLLGMVRAGFGPARVK